MLSFLRKEKGRHSLQVTAHSPIDMFFYYLRFVTGSYDFFGINHYSSIYVTSGTGSDSGVSTVSTTVSYYTL